MNIKQQNQQQIQQQQPIINNIQQNIIEEKIKSLESQNVVMESILIKLIGFMKNIRDNISANNTNLLNYKNTCEKQVELLNNIYKKVDDVHNITINLSNKTLIKKYDQLDVFNNDNYIDDNYNIVNY